MEEFTQITLDQWTEWKEDIRRKLAETAGNFVYIGFRLKQIRDSGMFGGAADVFEFATKEYGLGKSTVSRFIAINEKYSEGGNSIELREEFKNFSSSKLAEMLTLSDSEIELITEQTTVKEIRALKEFDRQQPPEEAAEPVTWSPLEKCLIDFFKERKEALGGVMRCMNEETPQYKRAMEYMNPSGNVSHKKGIVFLFLYGWDIGAKYKLMTAPDPVSITWQQLLNIVYGIYGACNQEDVWGDFYKPDPADEKGEEKTVQPQSIQAETAPVATSQQTEETEAAEEEIQPEPEEIQQPPGPEQTEVSEESEENVTETQENGTDPKESETPEPESEPEDLQPAAGQQTAGKYDKQIAQLLEDVAYKSQRIAEELAGKERKELQEYKKIRGGINVLNINLEQLMRFIDLAEEDEEDE